MQLPGGPLSRSAFSSRRAAPSAYRASRWRLHGACARALRPPCLRRRRLTPATATATATATARSGPALPLLTLARDNLGAEIRAAVAAGHDVNAGNAIQQRPLHIASLHGNLEAMAALLECGADANATNERGLTPLVRAAAGRARRRPRVLTQALPRRVLRPLPRCARSTSR